MYPFVVLEYGKYSGQLTVIATAGRTVHADLSAQGPGNRSKQRAALRAGGVRLAMGAPPGSEPHRVIRRGLSRAGRFPASCPVHIHTCSCWNSLSISSHSSRHFCSDIFYNRLSLLPFLLICRPFTRSSFSPDSVPCSPSHARRSFRGCNPQSAKTQLHLSAQRLPQTYSSSAGARDAGTRVKVGQAWKYRPMTKKEPIRVHFLIACRGLKERANSLICTVWQA